MGTKLGTSLTFIAGVVVLVYAIAKFSLLGTVRGSTVTFFQHETPLAEDAKFVNLQEKNFRVAFAFDGMADGKFKSDPKYVRYIARLRFKNNEEYGERILPHHVCTDDDYALFYPMESGQKKTLEAIRASEDLDFLCIDWPEDDPYLIYGSTHETNYQLLEFIMTPCNYAHKEFSEVGLEVGEECIRDRDQQLEYLTSTLNLRILYNEEIFDPTLFNEDKHVRFSNILHWKFNPARPSFVPFTIREQELEDDTALIQFG